MAEGFPYPRGGFLTKTHPQLRVVAGKMSFSSIGEICDPGGYPIDASGLQQAMYYNQEMQKAIRCHTSSPKRSILNVQSGECWADGPNMVLTMFFES